MQKGDSAVIQATVRYGPDALRVLVGAGSDLNLQNEVRYTVTVATWYHPQLSILGGSHCPNDRSEELEK